MSESGDINATDDESNAGISPVSSALTKETNDITEEVSARQSTMRGPLNHGSNEPRIEDLGYGGNSVDEYDTTTGDSYNESDDDGEDDTTLDGWYTESEDDCESEDSYDSEEDEDSAPSTPRWDPSTYVYVPALDFPQQSPLPPLPMNETYYPEDELADDEKDLESSSSGCGSDRDVKREEVDVDLETDVSIRRPPFVHQPGPLESNLPSSVPPRIGKVAAYMNRMSQGGLRWAGRGRGDVRGEGDPSRGRKRESDDENETDERAYKIQRKL